MNTRYEVAIRRSDDGRVLVLADRSLPSFSTDAPPPWPIVTIVADEMRSRHGLDVVTLRAASVEGTSLSGTLARRVYEAELIGGSPPAGAAWVDDADLGEELAGLVRPARGDRHPWYRPGWLAEMSDWIDERLSDGGIRRRGPIRQVRSWGRAALLTFDTDRGRLWAKAVPDVFSHEVTVTELLADIDPGIVPPVVASDRALGRIITEHVEGPSLDAPVFLDWSDGSITHPFLSAASILLDRGASVAGCDDEAVAYLGPWLATGQVTPTGGREALSLARIVLPLHLAALYAERILPGLEQRWEVEWAVPDAMRAILPG